MESLDLDKIHLVALEACEKGREILLDYFGRLSQVSEKENSGLVSEADVTSEEIISQHLKANFPDFSVLGEESSFAQGVDLTKSLPDGAQWILDPLDGTTNYIHGFYAYCISLALEYKGEIVYGIVDVPALQTTYYAKKGQGAFKNNQPIKVSPRNTLEEALIVTGFSSKKEIRIRQIKEISPFLQRVRGLRRTGSAAYDLCLVSEGVFDAYWEEDLNSWDVAAGALLVQEAGGHVSNFTGENFDPHRKEIVAATTGIYQEVVNLLTEFRPVKN